MFEERVYSMDRVMEEWVAKSQTRDGSGLRTLRQDDLGQQAQEISGPGKWGRFKGTWVPKPIGVL